MRFSQKIGKTSIRENIQIESIDERLENRLWNVILNDFFDKIDNYSRHGTESQKGEVCQIIWKEFFGKRADEISSYTSGGVYIAGVISFIKEWYSKWFLATK